MPDGFKSKDWNETIDSYKELARSIKTAKNLVKGIIQNQKEVPNDPIAARKRVEEIKERLDIEHQLKKDQEFIKEYNRTHPRKARRTLLAVLIGKIRDKKNLKNHGR